MSPGDIAAVCTGVAGVIGAAGAFVIAVKGAGTAREAHALATDTASGLQDHTNPVSGPHAGPAADQAPPATTTGTAIP